MINIWVVIISGIILGAVGGVISSFICTRFSTVQRLWNWPMKSEHIAWLAIALSILSMSISIAVIMRLTHTSKPTAPSTENKIHE